MQREIDQKDATIRELEKEKSNSDRILEEMSAWLDGYGRKFIITASNLKRKSESRRREEQEPKKRKREHPS
jgi:hypothetical protein